MDGLRSLRPLLYCLFLASLLAPLPSIQRPLVPGAEWLTYIGSSEPDMGLRVAADPDGGIYVFGETLANWDTRKKDLFLMKLSSKGEPKWLWVFGGSENESVTDVEVSSGYVYVLGETFKKIYLWGQPWDCPDIILGKFDLSGRLIWMKYLDTGYCEYSNDLEVVGRDLYIAGSTWYGSWEEFIVRVSDRGGSMELNWFKLWNNDAWDDELDGLDSDGQGNIYGVGILYKEGTDVSNIHLLKFDSSGEVIWSKMWDSGNLDEAYRIVFNNDVYVCGDVVSQAGGSALVMRVNRDGDIVWVRSWGTGPWNSFYELAVPGDILLAGESNNDAIVAKVSRDGKLQWALKWGGGGWDWFSGVTTVGDSLFLVGASQGGEKRVETFTLSPKSISANVKDLETEFSDVTPEIGTPNFQFKNTGLIAGKSPSQEGDAVVMKLLSVGAVGTSDFYDLERLGFPGSFKYFGLQTDILMNEHELSGFAGKGVRDQDTFIVLLGGPAVYPAFVWERYGARFERVTAGEGSPKASKSGGSSSTIGGGSYYARLVFRGETYVTHYGEEDYAVIIYDKSNVTLRVAGITRYGTRAGLLWLPENPRFMRDANVVLIGWKDSNGNGKVELGEITRIYP